MSTRKYENPSIAMLMKFLYKLIGVLWLTTFIVPTMMLGQEGKTYSSIQEVRKGITLQAFKKKHTNGVFIPKPLYDYGIDSEAMGWVFVQQGKPQYVVWTKAHDIVVEEIIILSSNITVDGTIKVGSSFADFLHRYPKATVALDMVDEAYEYATALHCFYTIEALTQPLQRIGEYNEEGTLKKLLAPQHRIDRIRIKGHTQP
ncbi:hypothetical protein ACG2LH_16610 [Zhouia sp. PK063]|uniref:hypothetical protein n=1 Tax=Zhouia sp. PK063 TaxID=3373602 RepID=UPI00379BCCC9